MVDKISMNHFVILVRENKALFLKQFDSGKGFPIWSKSFKDARKYPEHVAEIAAKNSGGLVAQL